MPRSGCSRRRSAHEFPWRCSFPSRSLPTGSSGCSTRSAIDNREISHSLVSVGIGATRRRARLRTLARRDGAVRSPVADVCVTLARGFSHGQKADLAGRPDRRALPLGNPVADAASSSWSSRCAGSCIGGRCRDESRATGGASWLAPVGPRRRCTSRFCLATNRAVCVPRLAGPRMRSHFPTALLPCAACALATFARGHQRERTWRTTEAHAVS